MLLMSFTRIMSFLAERLSRLMDLDICGIDVIAEDITQPINEE